MYAHFDRDEFEDRVVKYYKLNETRSFIFRTRRLPKKVLNEVLQGKILKRKDISQFKLIWILEDIISITLIIFWFIMILFYPFENSTNVIFTIFVFTSVLIINSLFDYIYNCNYYFFNIIEQIQE